jgi:hypothetical protein
MINDELSMTAAVIEEILDEFQESMPPTAVKSKPPKPPVQDEGPIA